MGIQIKLDDFLLIYALIVFIYFRPHFSGLSDKVPDDKTKIDSSKLEKLLARIWV